MTINELIAECERLDKEATPGPWSRIVGFSPLAGATNHLGRIIQHSAKPVESVEDYEFAAHSRTLLPLLVKVIKNQQRQIDAMRPLIEEVHELDSGEQDCIAKSCGDALITVNLLSAELEDVKP